MNTRSKVTKNSEDSHHLQTLRDLQDSRRIGAALDIGGTKVAVCLAAFAKHGAVPVIIERFAEPTTKTGDEQALSRQLLRMLGAACERHAISFDRLCGLGVASCGPFVRVGDDLKLSNPNICGGLAEAASSLSNLWTRLPLEAPLSAALPGLHLRIANDAVAALEAERRWGALQGFDDCAYVTWSTGIGVGLCVDGHVLRGKNGNAGHAGHTFVGDLPGEQPVCGCGNVGDIEAWISGRSIASRFDLPAAELMTRATQGDAPALNAVKTLSELMGRLLYNLVATLDLRRISLGGAVFLNHVALLLPLLRAEIARYMPALTQDVELVPAGLGTDVGDYAGLALVA